MAQAATIVHETAGWSLPRMNRAQQIAIVQRVRDMASRLVVVFMVCDVDCRGPEGPDYLF